MDAASLARDVRTSLGRGKLDEARKLAAAPKAPADARALAQALVAIFEGQDDQAKQKLQPLVDAGDGADALLELGLLELRHGRTESGRTLLAKLLQQNYDLTPDNAFRMARAAAALGDIRLANSTFQRIGSQTAQTADVEATWGDMLREKHQAGEAARSYRASLEADAAWVAAHLGLARVLTDEDPVASAEATEAALKLAPSHPDVWLLMAEKRLEAEDVTGARQALDEVAKVRPGTPAEGALRAAIAYSVGDTPARDAAIARVLAYNPTYAQIHLALGRQAARQYRFDDAVGFARQAVKLNGEDSAAHADLGLYLLRTGDEKDARVELEGAFRIDPFDTVTYNLLQLLDTLDTFEVVESGPFTFKFSKDEAAVLKPYAIPLALRAYKVMQERYGFTPKGPILVEIFPKHDDFAVRTLGLPGLVGALGACFGRVVTMDSPRVARDHPDRQFAWQAVLWHEIAHVFTLQMSNFKVPRWLTEGLSVYEEHRVRPAWGRELGLEFARTLSKGKTFGVKGLPKAFERPQSIALAYFEASLLAEHLVTMNGDAGLRTLLLAYAEGANDTAAFAKAFGRSVDEVDASFKKFVDERYGAVARALADPPGAAPAAGQPAAAPPSLDVLKARVAATPGSFLAQWSLGQALYDAGEFAAAKAPLERATELAPMATGDGSPNVLLADIALRAGDTAGARRKLRDVLAWDHDNVGVARRLAGLAAEAKASEDQEFALRAVADLDPFDAEAHSVLGRSALARKDYAAALAEFEAALALGPSNLAEAYSDLGEVYLGLGRKEDAKREALRALEQAPTYARAQDLLLAAIGKG